MYSTLISASQLQTLIRNAQSLLIVDCSYELANPTAGHDQYLHSHLPRAFHADLSRDLSAQNGAPQASGGRHPLPTRETVADWLSTMGVQGSTQVVVYDRQCSSQCGRLWWMLKWCGHEAVAILDGGLNAWMAAGGLVESGEQPQPATNKSGPFILREPLVSTAAGDHIPANLNQTQIPLIDARATPRLLGEVGHLDPIAGHMPGALNRPFAENFGEDGFFKTPEALRVEFEALLGSRDPKTVIHHCGSGVSAIPNLVAMELAGMGRTALYPGSWSEWSRTPGRAIAKG